jgi:hypothetical protein
MTTDHQLYQISKIIEALKTHSCISPDLLIRDNFKNNKFGASNEFYFKPDRILITFNDLDSGPHIFTSIPMLKFANYNLGNTYYVIGHEGNQEPVVLYYISSQKTTFVFDKKNDGIHVNITATREFKLTKLVEKVDLPSYILNDDEFILLYRLINSSQKEYNDFFEYVPYFFGPQKEFNIETLKQQLELYDMYKY